MKLRLPAKKAMAVLLPLCLGFLSPEAYSQEENTRNQTIPTALRRPERGESPRYPQDLVIGVLGQGDAPTGAYNFAQNLLSALITGSSNNPALEDTGAILTESLHEEIYSIEPRIYRLGGGRDEPDGCVSFMVRFLGPEESITGELFVRQAEIPEASDVSEDPEDPDDSDISVVSEDSSGGERPWVLDDLILEEKRALSEIRDSYRYDFSPYERFY